MGRRSFFFLIAAGLDFQEVEGKKINEHEWIKQIRVTKVRECGGGLLMTIKRQRKIIFGVNNANTHTHTLSCSTPTCACHDHKGCWVIMLMML